MAKRQPHSTVRNEHEARGSSTLQHEHKRIRWKLSYRPDGQADLVDLPHGHETEPMHTSSRACLFHITSSQQC